MRFQFTKMHCCSNDYTVIESFSQRVYDPFTASLILNDRRFGIGADAMLVLSPSDTADAKLEIFACDGTDSDPAGCALRCAAKLLRDQNLCGHDRITFETAQGMRSASVAETDPVHGVSKVRVDYDFPAIEAPVQADVHLLSGDAALTLHPVRVGDDRYAVLLTDESFPEEKDITQINLASAASELRKCPGFSASPLVIAQADEKALRMRMWRTGSGEVRANPLGALAASAVLLCAGKTASPVQIFAQGGEMTVTAENDRLSVEGPVSAVFDGLTQI